MSTAPRPRPRPVVDSGVPRLPPWHLPRPGLANTLREADEPLVVLRGPGGAGKTTVAAELAHAALADGNTLVWLDVARFPDRAALWQAAARQLGSAGVLDEDRDPGTTSDDLAATSVALTSPVILVLDGYESLACDDLDGDILAALRTSWMLTVVVTTRRVGRFESLEARLAVGVRTVTSDELALDRTQVADLCAAAGVTVPGKVVERVAVATGGLPAFVRTVVLAAREGELPLAVASSSTIVAVAARAGLALLASGERDDAGEALAVLAVPPALTTELADLLVDDGRAALETAEESGLGEWATTRGVTRFRFVPVVRTSLRTRLRTADPDRFGRALAVTSDWATRTREHTMGFESSLERKDYATAQAHLLGRWSYPSSQLPDNARLALYDLSLGTLARYPILALATALLYFSDRRDRVRAMEMLALSIAGAVAWYPRAAPGERAILLGAESVANRLLGRGERAGTMARRALATIEQVRVGDDPTFDKLRPLVLQHLASSLLAAGEVEASQRAAELATLALPRDDTRTLQARVHLAGILATAGEIDRAAEIVDTLPPDPELVRAFGVYYAAMATVARTYVALERGHLGAARAFLRDAEQEMRTNEYWPLHALARFDLDLVSGRAGAPVGQDRLDPARLRAPASAFWKGRLAIARSHLALTQGRGDAVTGELRRLRPSDPAVRTARARVHHARGDDVLALKELGEPPGPTFGTRTEIEHHVVRGLCLVGTGDLAAAARELERALALSHATGCRLPWLLTSEVDRALVEEVTGDVGDVFRGLPLVVPSRLGVTTLSERELVVLEQLASGQGITEVARSLHVSPNTVKTQLRHVYRKLGVGGRHDAVLEARRRGILR